MNKNEVGLFFPLFALFVIFSDEMFFSVISLTGADVESGMKAREAMVIAGIAYLLIGIDIFKQKYSKENAMQFLVLFVILVMYFITGNYFPHIGMYDKYWSSFLSYGALCIPSCYVGMRLARARYDEKLILALPYFLIMVSLIVGSAIWLKSLTGALLGPDDVFSYQTSSYYMAFCFSYCFFYVFFVYDKRKTLYQKVMFLILLGLLFVCALGTILGGGRGAFVYLVLVAAYLIYRRMKRSKGGVKVKYMLLLAVAAIAMIFLAIHLNVLESAGANRLLERLNVEGDDIRKQMWDDAINAFYESPFVGHGLGSIWWTVGFYSHNLLSDLLAETGVIGTVIVIYVLIHILIRQSKRSYYSSMDMFLLLVYLGAIVHDAFSGYWITSSKLFLLFGYVYALKDKKVIKTKIIDVESI